MSSKLQRRRSNPLGIPRHVERNDAIPQYTPPPSLKWVKDEQPKQLTPKEFMEQHKQNPNRHRPDFTMRDLLIQRNILRNPNLTKIQKQILLKDRGQEQAPEYTVREGDNLWNIAKANNLTLGQLRALNPQQKGDTIHVGDKLKVGHAKKSEWVNVLAEQKKEEQWNKSNASAIFNFKHTGSFIVVDKANTRLTVYDKNNNPLFTTTNIASGASGNDYNTITYTDDSGELKDMMGNNSTPAGITYIGNISNYHGLPSFTRQRQNRDGSREDIASSMHYSSNTSKAHISNGCIRVGGTAMKEIAKYVTEGTPIYVLPEKPGSKFVLRAGKLNYIADNPYGVDTGEKKLWDDYNVHVDKSYNPLSIRLVKKKDDEYNRNAQRYADAVSSNKERIQKQLNLSNYEFNHLAQIAMGIGQVESKFGTSKKYKYIKLAPVQTYYHAAKWFWKNTLGNFGKQDPTKIKYYPFEGNSKGISQIKYSDDVYQSKDLQKLYSQYGINDGSDLNDPGKAGIATILRLGYIYNTEIKGRNFTGYGKEVSPWDALIYAYNGRQVQLRDRTATPENNGYVKGVNDNAKNFEYLEYRTYDE